MEFKDFLKGRIFLAPDAPSGDSVLRTDMRAVLAELQIKHTPSEDQFADRAQVSIKFNHVKQVYVTADYDESMSFTGGEGASMAQVVEVLGNLATRRGLQREEALDIFIGTFGIPSKNLPVIKRAWEELSDAFKDVVLDLRYLKRDIKYGGRDEMEDIMGNLSVMGKAFGNFLIKAFSGASKEIANAGKEIWINPKKIANEVRERLDAAPSNLFEKKERFAKVKTFFRVAQEMAVGREMESHSL